MSVESSTTVRTPRRGGLSRYTFAGAVATAGLVGLAFALTIGLGKAHHATARTHGVAGTTRTAAVERSPRAGRDAGAGMGAGTSTGTRALGHGTSAGRGAAVGAGASHGHGAGGAVAAAGAGRTAAVAEVRDPEEARSFPVPASVSARHRAASSPGVAAETVVAPGAASDAEIRRELREEEHAKAQEQAEAARARALARAGGSEGGSSVGGNGTIPIPANVPEAVQRVIAGGNAIADFPYIWGGGHGSFVARGYDCSGSVSYALAAGGLLGAPLVSGELASWGAAGPGRWITIYANAGHTFMNVDGIWFDTAGRSGPYASRWILATPPLEGYAVRHPPGL